jgi:hypothetical protein
METPQTTQTIQPTIQPAIKRPAGYYTQSKVALLNVFSVIFLIIAGFIVFGAFNQIGNPKSIVGGDAYNYLIAGNRAIFMIGTAIFSGIVSLILAVFALVLKINPDRSN